jgi:hypothetical protein
MLSREEIMTTRSEALKHAEQAASNKDGTEKIWSIQSEMEAQGFKYDSTKGAPDVESAYSAMKVDIYQSTVNPSKYMSVEVGVSVDRLKVPDTDFRKVKIFKERVDLTSELIAFNVRPALAAIRDNGFYLHGILIQ